MAGLGANISANFQINSRMSGSISLGGTSYNSWFFEDVGNGIQGFMGDRTIPSTHMEFIEGTACTIDFFNQSPMDHTIHLHGLDVDQVNDGVGDTSFTVFPGNSNIYSFVAPHAGTYHYHCHVDTTLHYARGMYGTVIVRPPSGSTSVAWDGGPSFDEEVLWQLSSFDSTWMNGFSSGSGTARFRPDLFTINGFETAAATADPYTRVVATVGQKVYLRVSNSAYNWTRVSLGGLPFEVIDTDGRPMQTSYTTTSLELGPGERYGLLLDATTAGTYQGIVEYLNEYTGGVWGDARTEIVIV